MTHEMIEQYNHFTASQNARECSTLLCFILPERFDYRVACPSANCVPLMLLDFLQSVSAANL